MTGEEFRYLRDSMGLTQGNLAISLGVSAATIGTIEKSKYVRSKYASSLTALVRKHQIEHPPAQLDTPVPYNYAPLGVLADALAIYNRLNGDVAALYRLLKAATAEGDRLRARLEEANARRASDAGAAPRPSGRMTAAEIAQRQVDTKLERRRLTEERIAAATIKWDEDAFAKVTDCAQRWPYLTRDETMIEIENIRNSPLGDHRRLLDFINVYIHTGRAADPRNPEDASIFTPTDRPYQPLAKLFLPPMPQ